MCSQEEVLFQRVRSSDTAENPGHKLLPGILEIKQVVGLVRKYTTHSWSYLQTTNKEKIHVSCSEDFMIRHLILGNFINYRSS